MTIAIEEILDVLRDNGVSPEETANSTDLPQQHTPDFPEVGEIQEGESIYATSVKEIFADIDEDSPVFREPWDERLDELEEQIREIIRGSQQGGRIPGIQQPEKRDPPEPHCAWYCPIHFYGRSWGIYIRESCILSAALDIAGCVDWRTVRVSPPIIVQQLLRSAFYVYFLHEQFHHKVESFGFRSLITSGSDCYRPYKTNVYRTTLYTPNCLEEGLANAESYRRLSETRYSSRTDGAIRTGLRLYLKSSFRVQPPGYAEGLNYLSERAYRQTLYNLQSQIVDGSVTPSTTPRHWVVAPNMITALTDITDDIYVVLPRGRKPIFPPTSVDPGATVSSRELVSALTRYHGYNQVQGGKGSHVKLSKPGSPTLIIPGNRPVVSPGVVKHALRAVGGHPISRVRDLVTGKL